MGQGWHCAQWALRSGGGPRRGQVPQDFLQQSLRVHSWTIFRWCRQANVCAKSSGVDWFYPGFVPAAHSLLAAWGGSLINAYSLRGAAARRWIAHDVGCAHVSMHGAPTMSVGASSLLYLWGRVLCCGL